MGRTLNRNKKDKKNRLLIKLNHIILIAQHLSVRDNEAKNKHNKSSQIEERKKNVFLKGFSMTSLPLKESKINLYKSQNCNSRNYFKNYNTNFLFYSN